MCKVKWLKDGVYNKLIDENVCDIQWGRCWLNSVCDIWYEIVDFVVFCKPVDGPVKSAVKWLMICCVRWCHLDINGTNCPHWKDTTLWTGHQHEVGVAYLLIVYMQSVSLHNIPASPIIRVGFFKLFQQLFQPNSPRSAVYKLNSVCPFNLESPVTLFNDFISIDLAGSYYKDINNSV